MYPYRLSIIVPVYNVELYLERCVRSLLRQDLPCEDYEVILIDDGSTDRSGEISRHFAEKYPNIRVAEQINAGASVARNHGMDLARGKYIMFVDSDDFIEPNVIGTLVSMAEQNELDLLFYDSRFYPIESRLTARQPFELNRVYNGEYATTHGLFFGAVWSNLYSHDFIKHSGVRFHEGILHEDVEFNCKLYPRAQRILFSDMLVYNYFVGNSSSTRRINLDRQKKSVMDDIIVIENVIHFAKSPECPVAAGIFLCKKMNSTLVSVLISICRQPIFDLDFVNHYLEAATQHHVYPIAGSALSYKSTCLIPLLNVKGIYLFFAWLLRNKK